MSRMRAFLRSKFVKLWKPKVYFESSSNHRKMYGAHGSFMIFTKYYFSKGAHVDYPRFLFGEETFVAEQLRMNGLIIKHVPNIKVFDEEHGSTSKLARKFICAEHKKSYEYFYENFIK